MNTMTTIKAIILSLAVVLTISCTSGSDGDGGSGGFTGTWFGSLEDPGADMHSVTLVMSGLSITSIALDGIDQGVTGTITRESSNVYSFELSDTTVGGFVVDDTLTHAGFVDEDFNVGVIQKGAGTLPGYVQSDIFGTASGVVVETDFLSYTQTTSSVTCDAVGDCSGTDGFVGNFTTSAALDDSVYGRWYQTTNSNAGIANGSIILSVDKTFASAYGCINLSSFPGTCSFSAWTKN